MAGRANALALIAAVSLMSAYGISAGAENDQKSEEPTIADFFDGLRAWKLKEEPTAAAIWLRAAEWGDVGSMEKIGELYERGEVLPHDVTLAYFWSSQAARRGAGSAKAAVDRLRPQLPAASIPTIEATIEKWQPKPLITPVAPTKKSDAKALITALNEGDLQSFEAILSSGVSAKSLDPTGVPVIFLAVAAKQVQFVKSLLEHEADPNVVLANGMTPLHIAAGLGNRGIVELLVAKGGSTAIQDQNGAWPVDLAERKRLRVLTGVLQAQLDVDIKNFRTFLEEGGYIAPNEFLDLRARELAVRMFQQANDIETTGYTNLQTLQKLTYSRVHYSYIYTYKEGNHFRAHVGNSKFNAADTARGWAMEACRAEGSDCKVYLAPSGGCIALAKGPAGYRVSRAMLTRSDAEAEALAQCVADSSKDCSVATALCG